MRPQTIVLALVLSIASLGCDPKAATRLPGGPVAQAENPQELIRAYYKAIDEHQYEAAYSAWGDGGAKSGQRFDEFKAGFAQTERMVMEIIGPVETEGAAGSIYASVPVVVRADSKDGERKNFNGRYVVKRVNDVPGATPEQLRWHIDSADLREIR